MNAEKMIAEIKEFSIGQIFTADAKGASRYVVPLYQREYAWGKIEIERLLNDLYLAFNEGCDRNYYLGSFVVRRDKADDSLFELVDGQQRLITLSLLFARYLNDDGAKKVLSFQLREDADDFIDRCYSGGDVDDGENTAFSGAVNVLDGFYPESLDGCKMSDGQSRRGLNEVLEFKNKKGDKTFKDYLLNKVILFRVELPGATDVNAYFEIMNNRGEQLKYHEIMKADLLAKLERKCHAVPELDGRFDELAVMFDDIWTACSRMNGYLGHHLHACSEYDQRPLDGWTDKKEWERYQHGLSTEFNGGTEGVEQSVFSEFANFLMHALKCYQKRYLPTSEVVVTLDERDMQTKYEALKDGIDPVRFLDLLIRLRLKFDKYVVKAETDENGDVSVWRLSYVKKNSKSYDVVNTFDGTVQSKLIYFESMLQVSFNTQRNKDWLQSLLELDDGVLGDGERLLGALKTWSKDRLLRFKRAKEDEGRDFYCLGLETPRHMLNLLDYLMWEASQNSNANGNFNVPEDFVFKYLNSVEHHHPQHDDQLPPEQRWYVQEIDDIGNLFLVYSSENASMNNREPQEKKNRFMNNNGNMLPSAPKRRWMYEHTSEADGWTLDEMKILSRYVRKLLNEFLAKI